MKTRELVAMQAKMAVAGIRDKISGKSQPAFVRETIRAILQKFVLDRTVEGAVDQTDQASACEGLESVGRRHQTVNHGAGEYVRHEPDGNTSPQTALCPSDYSHHISAKHLAAYLNELAFRVNTGSLDTIARMSSLACNMKAKRLMYADITAGTL